MSGKKSKIKTGPTSGDVGALPSKMQSVLGLYSVNGAVLPFQLAARGSLARKKAADALRVLRGLGFKGPRIRKLLDLLRIEIARNDIVDAWPSAGDDRKALEALVVAASRLQAKLLGLSPRASLYLNSGAHALKLEEDDIGGDVLSGLQRLIASALHGAREFAPYQDRAGLHTNIIEAVVEASRGLDLKPSASKTSRFCRACVAVFELADVKSERAVTFDRPSPLASIRAYLSVLVRNGKRMNFHHW